MQHPLQRPSPPQKTEFEASRRQLPPLASSLAYANYRSWASTNAGQELPDVAPGVSLTDLYRAGEREVRGGVAAVCSCCVVYTCVTRAAGWRATHATGSGHQHSVHTHHATQEALLKQWQAPSKPRSTLDSFANGSGYQQMATEAMARARARLLGYEDDDTLVQRRQQQPTGGPGGQQQEQPSPGARRVLLLCCGAGRAVRVNVHDSHTCVPGAVAAGVSPAAERVLDELLLTCCCREERATLLPEAFVPPGLEVRRQRGGVSPCNYRPRLNACSSKRQKRPDCTAG
jgi:hypothetical protein